MTWLHYEGPWLLGVAADGPSLLFPGRPAMGAASLRLCSSHVDLAAAVGSPLRLEWSDGHSFRDGSIRLDLMEPPSALARWELVRWSSRGSVSLDVAFGGHYVAASADLRMATSDAFDRINRIGRQVVSVPLLKYGGLSRRGYALIAVLLYVLTTSSKRRAALDDHERVVRLAADIHRFRGRPVPPSMFGSRLAIEVTGTLVSMGYVHTQGGRPLPGDVTVDLDAATAQVIDRLTRSPYAVGVHIDPDHVRHIVERLYTGVEPWPFAALYD